MNQQETIERAEARDCFQIWKNYGKEAVNARIKRVAKYYSDGFDERVRKYLRELYEEELVN